MDKIEKIAYGILGCVAALYIVALVVGMVMAFPYGLVGLALLVGIGLLFIKVLKERLANTEDDYYSKRVDK